MPLGEFIHALQCWHSTFPAVHQGVLSTVLAAIVAEINCVLQKVKLILIFFFLFNTFCFLNVMLEQQSFIQKIDLCTADEDFVCVGMEQTGNFICYNFILELISQISDYSCVGTDLS